MPRGAWLARRLPGGDGASEQALDVAEQIALVLVAERDRAARRARAAGAADAVHIRLGHVGELEVDDVGDAVDVDAARGDVGRDEDADRAAAEALERALARALRLVAVDRRRRDAGSRELIAQAVGAVLGAGEDERALGALGDEHVDEAVALLRTVDVADGLVHRLGCGRLGGDGDADRLDEHLVRELCDLRRKRRREEQRLTLARQHAEHPAHVVDEAHVEHAVGLVEDEDLDAVEPNEALLHEVEETPRCGDEQVGPARERVLLLALADAAVDERGLDA